MVTYSGRTREVAASNITKPHRTHFHNVISSIFTLEAALDAHPVL